MTETPDIESIKKVMTDAELLFSGAEVDAAIARMAAGINSTLTDRNPLLLCLMTGALVVTGKLLPRLTFPLQVEYIHASRYRGETRGGELNWIHRPDDLIRGRCVLIVDDILDEGITLGAVVEACRTAGASEVYTAVLVNKNIGTGRAFDSADFTGLEVPDRYVFGSGMDYREYLRNCNGIYAVND